MEKSVSPNHQRRSDRMLQDSIARIVPRMALPTIMSFLINSIYSFTDTYFVSFLGTNATAAVGINSTLDQLILTVGSLLAIGAASYLARLLGQEDTKTASSVFSTAFFTAMGLGSVLMIAGLVFTTPMVRFLGATPTCERYAADYARYLLLGAPFMPACFVMNHCLRSEGYATFSMIGMCASSVLNCILDPIFIFVLDMGIGGAALATTISKLAMFAILVSHYMSRRSVIRLSLRFFTLAKDVVYNIVSIGASSFFRFGLNVLVAIILNNIAGAISDSILAAVSVSAKIMLFPVGIIHGFCNGAQPVVGINWGAKQYSRVEGAHSYCSRTAVAGALVMMALLLVFAKPIVAQFAGGDAEMLQMGRLCVIAQSIALPIYAWVTVVNMMCTGLGKAKYALILATSRQGFCFIPALYLLSYLFGAYGVAVSQAVADLLSLGLAIPIFIKLWRLIRGEMRSCTPPLCPDS